MNNYYQTNKEFIQQQEQKLQQLREEYKVASQSNRKLILIRAKLIQMGINSAKSTEDMAEEEILELFK